MGMDKHCVNEISFTNNFCFLLNLPVNNELGIVQDGHHEFIIKCFKPSQNHYKGWGKLSSQLIWERHFPDNLVSFNLHVVI